MRILTGFDSLPALRHPAASVGSFDGVHRGHGILLQRVAEAARRAGGESLILTFDPHPRITLGRQEGLRLLNSLDEKIRLIEEAGIDNLLVIPFDTAFSRIPSEAFVRDYLVGLLHIDHLVVGYNHRFGQGDKGNYDQLSQLASRYGFQVERVAQCDYKNEKVSSTAIRHHIEQGRLDRAAALLGHPYGVAGTIEGSDRFTPDDPLKQLPPAGIYTTIAGNGNRYDLRIAADGAITATSRNGESVPAGKIELLFQPCLRATIG